MCTMMESYIHTHIRTSHANTFVCIRHLLFSHNVNEDMSVCESMRGDNDNDEKEDMLMSKYHIVASKSKDILSSDVHLYFTSSVGVRLRHIYCHHTSMNKIGSTATYSINSLKQQLIQNQETNSSLNILYILQGMTPLIGRRYTRTHTYTATDYTIHSTWLRPSIALVSILSAQVMGM